MGLRFLAIACLVGAAFAGPLLKQSGSQCASQCSSSPNQKFDYEIGKAYTYEYRGENVISATGKPKQKASIEGLAVISVLDQCEMVLQLKNLRVQQKLSQEEIQELTQKLETPVPFAFQDGKVEHVCASPEEDIQSLNIKKGLISAFVNTMSKLDTPQEVKEFDSMGNCSTKYTVKYNNGWEIQKEKSLKSCSKRHSSVTALITNPYQAQESRLNTLPIFPDETLVCTQIIEDKIIKSVECEEKAQIKPLSQRESIVKFEGQVKLSLLSISPAQQRTQPIPQHRRQTLLYGLEEHKDVKTQERETQQLLHDMCLKNQKSMDVNVSKDFIQLVHLVKSLPYPSLSSIHSSMKDGRICSSKKVRDLFVDTLPMSGSDSAIKLMVELLEKKEISGLKAKFWPASLALIPNPSRETVSEIIPLLRGKPSSVVLLGVSALVHRFCSMENCDHERAVQEIASVLKQQLGERCSEENDSQVLAALKAFGNMGYHGEAEHCILECAQNKDKPTRLRLAAIDSFRRIQQKRPEQLISIYTDEQESSEIRIAAFASIMKQADESQLRIIKRTAEKEQDDQVSGYASTFIRNMNKTSSPLKQSVKQALKQIEINPPKVQYWQNSKNIEFSTFSHTLNIGGSVETDIIHSQDSKIPRSITTRFDADILNNNINIFEAGIRAEGLEAIIKNLIGLKDKIPKRPSWNLLSSDSILGGAEAEASAFIRTMNTEIFDLSASDLSAVGEMIKIADLMSQLAQGKSSDFSHSFLFMNSEVIIPSVTGRAYSFGVTGSATVGLTASTKLDFLRFPRNTDANVHFQPSFNVELSTTVGIQSNKHRPDIKLSTSMHLESDMAAQFKIKEGHLALASVSLPSENVVLARVSSNIVEIDSHHQEKPLFKVMQKKIDYCFDKLQKPTGLSICGMLEVPKPFVTKSFPFINGGVGSIELAIKKSDKEMKSFEFVLEKPRHQTPVQKYKASFDTPGSRISRRFAAELLVKEQGKGHKEYTLELISPFKSAGGKGSMTRRQDLVEGALELHSSSSQLFSVNASAHIASSQAKKVIKPSFQVIFGNHEPMKVEGVVSVTNGRKQLIAIDFKTNKPARKPMTLSGTITKEGSVELSKKSEWKISSDLSLNSIFYEAQVRSTIEKQSKQAQTISASFETDYKKGSQKHSLKLSGTSQKSSSKLSTNAQFQSTQFSAANWALKWEMQGKLRRSIRNDITLKYGRNPERSYISIKQNSIISETEPSQCNVVLKVPQYNIDSNLTVKHELRLGSSRKVMLDVDLKYKNDKHIKGLLHFDYPSTRPLKASTRAELQYPSGKVSYADEIEETSTNKFEGKARMQWKNNKQVELNYIYQILSERSLFHHELETSLKVPSRQSPIKTTTSVKLSDESLGLEGSLSLRQQPLYSLQANLQKEGASQLQVQSPKVDAQLKVRNEEQKKSFDLELKVKSRSPRRVLASASAQLGQEKSISAEMSWDADRQPEQKMALLSTLQTRGDKYSATTKLQVSNIMSIDLSESGEKSLLGDHEGSLRASWRNRQPISLEYSHQLSQGEMRCRVKYSQNGVEKIEAKLEGQTSKSSYGRELSAKASLVSLDRSFESKKLNVEFKQQKSGSSTDLKSTIFMQRTPSKTYKAEINSQYHSNGIEASARISTPHKMFSKQAALMSVRKSENSFSSSLSVEMPDNQIISFSSDAQRKSKEISTTVVFKSPFDIVRDVKAHISVDNHRSKKSVFSYLDVNSARIGDVEASMTKSSSELNLQSQIKVSPIPNVPFQGLSMSFKKSRSSVQLSGEVLMQGEQKINLTSQMRKDRSGISLSSSFSSPFRSIQQVNATYTQSRSSIDLSASALYSGNKNVSISSQISQERSKTSATVSVTTPYKIRDLKAHLSLEKQSSKKSLLAYFDTNGERQGDIEISYLPSSNGMELQSRLKTARSQELSTSTKFEKSSKSFLLSTKVVQGASRLMSFANRQQQNRQQSESLEKVLLDMEVSRKASWDDSKYSMRLSGELSPASVNITTSRSESNALNIEASACQVSRQNQCIKLKTVHKALRNAEGYRHYQRFSVDCEKSIGDSSEKIATANIIFTASEHDYKSKVVVEYQGKNIGYEARIHRRENEHDHCSFDSHIFMPSQTSRVRASLLHNHKSLLLEIEAFPDSAIPHKKLGLEMKQEFSQQQLSGYIKMSHPQMEKPITLTCQVQKQGWIPVQGKWELQYSPVRGSRVGSKSLTLELESNLQQQSSGRKSMSYKLYNQDQSIEASLELQKVTSRQQSSYGYEWSWKSQSGSKKGGVSVKVSRKQNSQPQEIEISYFTPSQDWKIQARPNQASRQSDFSVKMLSRGQMVKEMTIRTTENCIEMNVQRSGPIFSSSMCLNKKVADAVQFISVEATCRRHKCLNISIGIEPQNQAFMDIKLKWEKQELRAAMSEISGLKDLLQDRSLEELQRELKEEFTHLKNDLILPVWRDCVQRMKQMKEQIRSFMRHHQRRLQAHARYIEDLKRSWGEWMKSILPIDYVKEEVIHPIAQSVRCLMDTYFQLALKHIPDVASLLYDATKEQFMYCLKKFCVTGTFCHELIKTYERRGMKAAKKLLYNKIEQTKQSWLEQIQDVESMREIWQELVRLVKEGPIITKELLDKVFGRFMEVRIVSWFGELARQWEVVIRNRAIEVIDYVIAKINDMFSAAQRDQDFRTARELLQGLEEKLIMLWQNKEQIFVQEWAPLKSSVVQKSKSLLSDRFQVSEFDPKNGNIMIRMRHPLGRRHIQVVKNAITAAKQKLQQSIAA